jgi:prolyl-tRNA synthetase
MRQTELFTKVLREAPKEEQSENAKLLIRAGFIHKVMAGAYEYLPLGLRVLNNINRIIREEMDAAGAQELFLTSLQEKSTWEKAGRWSDDVVDIWFKTKLKTDSEVGLAFTHEEPLTSMMKSYISSYRDLPIYTYQIQTKFRNEIRAKSGIMRCREFLMKDMYSFCADQKQHDEFYERSKQAYMNVFKRMGLGDITYITFASGGSFSKFSHEFQTITKAGEDLIHVCEKCRMAVNNEIINEQDSCPNCGNKKLSRQKATEVGNIFSLGTKFSDAFNLTYTDINGEQKPVVMGSYGIGPGRVMGTLVEIFHDEKGIIWPKSIAPFSIHLINIADSQEESDKLYRTLQENGISVLYDQRKESAGAKFADADLIGIPIRLVVSDKTLLKNSVEIKERNSADIEIVETGKAINLLKRSLS